MCACARVRCEGFFFVNVWLLHHLGMHYQSGDKHWCICSRERRDLRHTKYLDKELGTYFKRLLFKPVNARLRPCMLCFLCATFRDMLYTLLHACCLPQDERSSFTFSDDIILPVRPYVLCFVRRAIVAPMANM